MVRISPTTAQTITGFGGAFTEAVYNVLRASSIICTLWLTCDRKNQVGSIGVTLTSHNYCHGCCQLCASCEASGKIFQTLTSNQQAEFLEAYFGASGNRYTLGRTHINSCDFSVGSYSFDDVDGDLNLTCFSCKYEGSVFPALPCISNLILNIYRRTEPGIGRHLRHACVTCVLFRCLLCR